MMALGASVALSATCTQSRAVNQDDQPVPPELLINYTMPEEGPLVVLNGKPQYWTIRDSVLRTLRGAVLDSIRVYPADSTTTAIFGSRGEQGVVVIATRPSG